MVKHGKRDRAGEYLVTVRHCRCIAALRTDVGIGHSATERACQSKVDLDAGGTFALVPQPIRNQAHARPYFQNFITQVHATERPGQDVVFKFLLPFA